MDLNRAREWARLLDLVQRRGPFDLAICTHTLEDLHNPFTALELLPLIAREGFITMPSLRCETSYVESTNKMFRGFCHHYWIWDQIDGEIMIIPKWPVVETLVREEFEHENIEAVETVVFHWQGDRIGYKLFTDHRYDGQNEMILYMRDYFQRYQDPRGPLKS